MTQRLGLSLLTNTSSSPILKTANCTKRIVPNPVALEMFVMGFPWLLQFFGAISLHMPLINSNEVSFTHRTWKAGPAGMLVT